MKTISLEIAIFERIRNNPLLPRVPPLPRSCGPRSSSGADFRAVGPLKGRSSERASGAVSHGRPFKLADKWFERTVHMYVRGTVRMVTRIPKRERETRVWLFRAPDNLFARSSLVRFHGAPCCSTRRDRMRMTHKLPRALSSFSPPRPSSRRPSGRSWSPGRRSTLVDRQKYLAVARTTLRRRPIL